MRYTDFADLLNKHLRDAERDAAWLARRLKVHASTVGRWSSGEDRPKTPEMVGRIADALGIYDKSERLALVVAANYVYYDVSMDSGETQSEKKGQKLLNLKENLVPFLVPSPPPQGVLGREDVIEEIIKLLELRNDNARDVAPVVLQGMGGIGKTTLAIAIGRHSLVNEVFHDGVFWVSVGPNPTVRSLLTSWGKMLGLDLAPEINEVDCRNALRAAFYQRRALLIIDDVWDTNKGQFFNVAGPYCRTLITTRELPIAYAIATKERTKRVDVLKENDAIELLRYLASEAVTGDMDTAKRLCEKLGYLPLALTLAGRLLVNEAYTPVQMQRMLTELIDRRAARLKLVQDEGRLGIDDDRPVSLQAILGMSVDRLDKADKERFAMLSVFGAEPLTWTSDVVPDIWDCSSDDAEVTISKFIQRGLIVYRPEYQDYWMHQLLADYAHEMMEGMGQ